MNKQLDVFQEYCDAAPKPAIYGSLWKLFIDGASRNNPGQAGAGVCLFKDNVLVLQEGFYLGIKTNNEAEYLALLLGLFLAKKIVLADDLLYIVSDSELLTKQLRGEYAVKRETLKPLHACARDMLTGLHYAICHVKRELNKRADKLANQGIDNGTPLPQEFVLLLREREITI